jgi:hypothetical protein
LIMNMPDESYFPETGRAHYIRYLRFYFTIYCYTKYVMSTFYWNDIFLPTCFSHMIVLVPLKIQRRREIFIFHQIKEMSSSLVLLMDGDLRRFY